MNESKIELTSRLRAEGRWDEAAKFKETARADFRAKGMKRAEAAEAAWEAMAEAYPPLSVAEATANSGAPEAAATHAPPENAGESMPTPAIPTAAELPPQSTKAAEVDVDALLNRIGDQPRPDLVRDVLWAYENLSNRRAKPVDAPSVGAWAMLEWARQYRNRFFEQVLPKAMTTRSQDAEDVEMQRRERMSISQIGIILGEMHKQWEKELMADVPEVVREKVRATLSDWSRRFALTVPDEARTSLETHVARFVQECMVASERITGGVD